jgi:hypothetical protein
MVELSNYLRDFLEVNQFEHNGNWEVSKDRKIAYSPIMLKSNIHCVYIWLARKNNQIVPLYVGKSKNGILERMKQHTGGFREDKNGSVSGRRKRKILEKLLDSNWIVEVHSKESRSMGNFDIISNKLFEFNSKQIESIKSPYISLYSFEEELLIRFFELNFSYVKLMNGLKDKDADSDEFLKKINSL